MKLYEMTAHETADMLRNGEIGTVELAKAYLERIDEIDNVLGSYITVTPEHALRQAERLQPLFTEKERLPQLAGIPAAIKDNILTKGIRTTCASKMLANFIPPYDATVSEKLAANEVMLLGKLNMDEFAMGSSTETSSYKMARNPWNTERVPGGSSGGAAAAVAAGEAAFALGSDTGGSVRQPAAFCGVVGMRPTYGAVSRYGLTAFASSLDQVGPITRDVTDAALVLNAICGHDPKDSTSADIHHPDYTKALINDVKGMKIGIPKQYIGQSVTGTDDEVKRAVLAAADIYASLGAKCEECSLPLTDYAVPTYYILSSAEASSNLARYDGIKYGYRSDKYKGLSEMYTKTRSEGFGKEVKIRIMLGTFVLSSGYYEAYYKKAQKVRTLIKDSFDEMFEKYDILIAPTTPTTAFRLGEKQNDHLAMSYGDIYTVSASIAGIPAMSIPCGFNSEGMPIGMQLMGKAFEESKLFRAGYTFEQNTQYHMKRPAI